ncbi:hypothetical protein DYBT9275_05998 [Dyadobacter sp. CECT 9275]|uniref:KTSC domain-containing protein n=1 Tax=Dyadobacter helix TaxID=2822344 RepID=A0A916JHT9_9BACT|nr:KTSC domain-containing protein [Dyadobacter sp. CECT 9275]CAG5018422.1 hypothetical protein DYBT9275_05998 [Dyadobacter sp. CECT 9275]
MPSSVIESMSYDTDTTLRIVFLSGTIYDYHLVPEQVFARMKGARSKGNFLNRYIKGKYSYSKVETE